MADRKKITARKKISAADQEKLLNVLRAGDTTGEENTMIAEDKPRKKRVPAKTQRVTVDFPQEMYERMKEETEMNGQTLRGFVISLVRRHFARLDAE